MAPAALVVAALCATGAGAISLHAEGIYSFGPRDGLICYQGPKDAMTDLYNRFQMGMNQEMFVNRSLWASPCEEHGFTVGLGQTCYGNTFSNTWSVERGRRGVLSAKLQKLHDIFQDMNATAKMGCATCHPHC